MDQVNHVAIEACGRAGRETRSFMTQAGFAVAVLAIWALCMGLI